MAPQEPSIPDAITFQAQAAAHLGSPQYAALLTDLRTDYEAEGLTYELLHDRPEAPIRDALVLRLMGAVHRIVLRGDAPVLAARYPSAGGDGSSVPVEDFLAVVRQHRAEVVRGLGENVQTNEVARSTSLVVGFAEVARRTGLSLNMLEIGSSGGLISNWDRYWYDAGTSTAGDPQSALHFTGAWHESFDVSGLTPVVARRGCDVAPLDPTDPEARLRLLSFLWPDQHQRIARLRAALDIAVAHPVKVDRADAGDWLAQHVPARPAGTATIVFHSIVWQYLPRETKEKVRNVLRAEGTAATADRPIAWVRLEPAGPVADVRLTLWSGDGDPAPDDEVLAIGMHHGGELRHPASDVPSVGHAGVR